MKTNRILYAASALVGALITSSAHANVIWTSTYTGAALPNESPSDPLWTELLWGSTTTASASGGIFTLSSTDKNDFRLYLTGGGADEAWNPGALGTTIEVRLKVGNVTPGAVWSQTLQISTGVKSYTFGWTSVQVQDFNTGDKFHFMDTTDEFHTYRFTISDTHELSLYVDDNPTPVITGHYGIDVSDNWLAFGLAGNALNSGTVEWEYVQWTNAGAFAPIPEPSTLLLLGVAGGAFLFRRKMAA